MLAWGMVLYPKNGFAQNIYLLYEVAISLEKAVGCNEERYAVRVTKEEQSQHYHKKEKQIV